MKKLLAALLLCFAAPLFADGLIAPNGTTPITGPSILGVLSGTSSPAAITLGIQPNQVPLLGNYQSTGLPYFPLTSRTIFARSVPTTGADLADIQISRNATYTGGTAGYVNDALNVACSTVAGETSSEWCGLFTLSNNGTAADASQNVGLYVQSKKVGTGATWGAVIQLNDYNANPTSATPTLELDDFSNDGDSNNQRVVLDIVGGLRGGGDGNTPTISYGARVNGTGAIFTNGLYMLGQVVNGVNVFGGVAGSGSAFVDSGSHSYGLNLGGTYSGAGIFMRSNTAQIWSSDQTITTKWSSADTCLEDSLSGTAFVYRCTSGTTGGIGVGLKPAFSLDVNNGAGTAFRLSDGTGTIKESFVGGTAVLAASGEDLSFQGASAEHMRVYNASTGVNIGPYAPNAGYTLNVNGTTRYLGTVNLAGAFSAPSWNTNGIALVSSASTFTDTTSTGTNTNAQAISAFAQPTLAATSATTYSGGVATIYIAGPPIAGANATFTGSTYSLNVQSGTARFGGQILGFGGLASQGTTTINTSNGTSTTAIGTGTTTGAVTIGSGNNVTTVGNLTTTNTYADTSTSYQTFATAGTFTLSQTVRKTVNITTTTIATFTLSTPASPVDGQESLFETDGNITALTLTGTAGATIVNAPTSLSAGQQLNLYYQASNTTWHVSTSKPGTVPTTQASTATTATGGTISVTFNTAFAAAPSVVITPISSSTTIGTTCQDASVTTTGFTAQCFVSVNAALGSATQTAAAAGVVVNWNATAKTQ